LELKEEQNYKKEAGTKNGTAFKKYRSVFKKQGF
jgi:hypothetical protein